MTSDAELIMLCEAEDRVMVTKDADFVASFLLYRKPPKPLLIATGNITNADLEALLSVHWTAVVAALQAHDFVELDRTAVNTRG